jgi:hypothetical protein
MEETKIETIETADQIKEAINNAINKYNQLKAIPKFLDFISPMLDCCINGNDVANIEKQQVYNNIKENKNKLMAQLKQLDFEFDTLIGYFASNHFMSISQQNEIKVDEEQDELVIKFSFDKFAKKFNSLDKKLFLNIKDQLIDVIKTENNMIKEQDKLFQQYERFIELHRGTKGYCKDEEVHTKKYCATPYKTLLSDK